MRSELEAEQNCNILTLTLIAITAFLSRSPGLLNRGPGGPASLGAGPLYRILSPTDSTFCAPSYIIAPRTPSSCGRHKSHSFNPSTVKVISWYSSTGCTCYLHWCISYFDSLAGVNMLHMLLEGSYNRNFLKEFFENFWLYILRRNWVLIIDVIHNYFHGFVNWNVSKKTFNIE